MESLPSWCQLHDLKSLYCPEFKILSDIPYTLLKTRKEIRNCSSHNVIIDNLAFLNKPALDSPRWHDNEIGHRSSMVQRFSINLNWSLQYQHSWNCWRSVLQCFRWWHLSVTSGTAWYRQRIYCWKGAPLESYHTGYDTSRKKIYNSNWLLMWISDKSLLIWLWVWPFWNS